MNRAALAAKLVSAASSRERSRLLAANAGLADAKLARLIKEICYSAWTAEPAKARDAAAALASVADRVADPEIEALAFWVAGIAEITKGRLESAIANLQAASDAFKEIGNLSESASPRVAMLIPLAMLGRYDEAAAVGKSALRIFEKHGDELAAGKVEMNLSNILSRQGHFRRSEKLGLAALSRFVKIGEARWQTMAENDLANTYTELNDFRKADEFYARALAGARSASMPVTEAEIEASMGNMALFRGKYGEALRFLELSRSKYDRLEMPHQSAVADLEIAGIYAALNLRAESIEIYRKVAARLKRLKMRGEEARARAELGRSFLANGDLSSARRELKRSVKLFEAERNSSGVAYVTLMLATLEIASRRFGAAATELDRAERTARKNGDARQRLTVDRLRSELLFARGKLAPAQRRLAALLPRARQLEETSIEQAALNLSGKIAGMRGDVRRAEAEFRKAIELIETLRSPLPAEEFRIAFFSAKLEPYENLANLLIEQRRFAEAFECFEQARSRALSDSMDGAGQPAASSGPLYEKIDKLREELNWYYSRAARADAEDRTQLRTEIQRRESELSDRLRRAGSFAKAAPLNVSARGLGDEGVLPGLQKQLGADTAFLEYVEIGGHFSVFVVTSESVSFVPDIATHAEVEPLLSGLRFQFDSLRYDAEAISAYGPMLKAKADRYLGRLHEKLLGPGLDLIGGRHVVIAPVSLLHYLPFHAFRSGDRYVVEEREVSYAPSAAVWSRLRSALHPDSAEMLLLGFADENNPLVGGEVNELKKLFRKRTVLYGDEATFDAYRKLAPRFDILHFACHGQFRPDNPSFSSLHLADGWVTVKDICSQHLKAGLVTLSACETGLNEIAKGEEIIGLARGFLSAGVASIVLSLWTVNDAATARLMKDLYHNLQRGQSITASLSTAQRNMIGDGQHPFYWSPFLVIGK